MGNSTSATSFADFPAPWDRIFPVVTRVFVWGLFFSVLYILRAFFLLIFLTFLFSYIQARGASRLAPQVRSRSFAVVLGGMLFLSILIAIGLFLVPRVEKQARLFANDFGSYLQSLDAQLYSLQEDYPVIEKLFPELDSTNIEATESPSGVFFGRLLGLGEEKEGQENVKKILETLGDIGRKLAGIGSAFLLALLFSFLIVLDLPRLSDAIADLRNTKLRFVYEEVADNIREFSRVLGKAIEAQLVIALINTFLTAIAINLLGLGDSVAFLSVIVFLCSFIPVAGVFVSSVPICLVALQVSGFQTMFMAIVAITVIHLIEGYILNPRIYGSHLRMNPVIVLIILTIGGKLFHFWGLILGVPVCRYIFGHAIRYKEKN